MKKEYTYEVIIIGGGIVGLSTAYNLKKQNPLLSVALLEKEDDIAKHQTGHNSGVIHSGIYYKPGSLKALNCKRGYEQLLVFCKEYGIKHEICGKLIVATKKSELNALDNIYERGLANGLTGLKKISSQEASEIEPYVSCTEAIWVPQTGIIDYTEVSRGYRKLFLESGGVIFLNNKVKDIIHKRGVTTIITSQCEYETRLVVNCAGLYSDKIAKLTHSDINHIKIIPFRGEYYELHKEKSFLVKNLIYPVPNPNFPFLGVHFTRMIKGGIEAGPNAVLAFSREGYSRWDINVSELVETLGFSGFQKVAKKYWDEGWMEMKRSFSKRLFVKAMQELIPDITEKDVIRSGAGVRAQACDEKGGLIDDFLLIENEFAINVCNAPSPAATASISIGETIADKALKKLKG